jgi:hypothetical protein
MPLLSVAGCATGSAHLFFAATDAWEMPLAQGRLACLPAGDYSIIVRCISTTDGCASGSMLGPLAGIVCAETNSVSATRSTHTTVASAKNISIGWWSNLAIIALSFLLSSAFFLAAYTAYLEGVSTALAELLRNYSYSREISRNVFV